MAQKWVQKAFEKRPGALHKQLNIPEDEKIPKSLLAQKERPLQAKIDRGERLTAAERQLKRRIDLVQTASKFHRKKSRA